MVFNPRSPPLVLMRFEINYTPQKSHVHNSIRLLDSVAVGIRQLSYIVYLFRFFYSPAIYTGVDKEYTRLLTALVCLESYISVSSCDAGYRVARSPLLTPAEPVGN